MIQRIQSIFLFVSLCFLVPMLFLPLAGLIGESGEVFLYKLTGFYETGLDGAAVVSHQYSLMLFGILICALNLIIIFMYKHRVLQMRLCIYNILLLAGLFAVMVFVLYRIRNIESISYQLPFIFPVVSIVLHYLAYRSIRKDELMVQAMSRLR